MSIEIYPVVHVTSLEQSREQSRLALSSGADGIYLINHSYMEIDALLSAFNNVSADNPGSFIGINLLSGSGAYQQRVLENMLQEGKIDRLPDGLWVDDAAYEEDIFLNDRELNPALKSIKYLGGTAFKYTMNTTEDPFKAARYAKKAAPYVDVVTTSGTGTGFAPNIDKIKAMKAAIGDQKLAVASGVSLENIDQYQGIVDEVLVSTSVETSPYSGIFKPDLLRKLIQKAHKLDSAVQPQSVV